MASSTQPGAWALQELFRRKIIGTTAYASLIVALLLGATQAFAAAVVTDTVVNLTTQSQSNVPVTFGQVFKDGDVPKGATLTATVNGQPVTLQVDPKATNPDGSLRHAVLTAMVPSLAGGAKLPLALATGAALPANPPISLSQLLATGYDAKAALNIGGTTYTVNARALLQAAENAQACKAWNPQCNVWLSGPLASEWVVNGPVSAANGTTNPNLRVYFAVRAYVGATPGTVARVRTDIIVGNTNAFAPQGQPQYTATLTSGSARYTSPALTQYTATRWHKVLWWNNADPYVYLQQDTQYIQDTKAISRYEPLQPDEKFLESLRQSCAPLDHCDQTQAMAQTGAQPAIGPLPRWTSVYILDPDVRAYNWMLANTDALGAYSIHYRDAATGFPVSIQRHPYVTIIDWSYANTVAHQNGAKGALYKADLLPSCVNNAVVSGCSTSWYGTGNPNQWDNAHQPAESYVPYMVTGSWYYMSELAFGASHNETWSSEAYRGYSQGLIDGSHGQVRGKAWVLREMADAAWLLPDSYPLKAEFNADVNNSIADWNQKYTDNPNANPLHVMNNGAVYSLNGGKNNGLAPWQHNFLTWSAGHAADLGFAGAAEFRNWLAKFEIGLMTDSQANPTQGYCWLEASGYSIQVKDAAGNWLPSLTAVYNTTFPTLAGLTCNSPAMVTAMGKLKGQPWQAGEMSGYPYSATGYPANFQTGLAAAVDSGRPNAQTAWSIFASRSVKPQGTMAYNDYPNFAVIPRTVTAGPVPPPTQPPPTTTPVASTTPPPVPVEPSARRCPSTGNVIPGCGGTVAPRSAPVQPGQPAPQAPGNSTAAGVTPGTPRPVFIDRVVRHACGPGGVRCARLLPRQVYTRSHAVARNVSAPSPITASVSAAPSLTTHASAPSPSAQSPRAQEPTAAPQPTVGTIHARRVTPIDASATYPCGMIVVTGAGATHAPCTGANARRDARTDTGTDAAPCRLIVVTGAGATRQACTKVTARR